MNVQQWNQFHLRHAEMHLSFIVPSELISPPEPQAGAAEHREAAEQSEAAEHSEAAKHSEA